MSPASRKIAILLPGDRAQFWHDALTPQLSPGVTVEVCVDEMTAAASHAEIIIGQQESLLSILANPPARLRWAHILSAGVDRAVAAAGTAPSFRMTNVSGIHAAAMREYVLMAMLEFSKDMRAFDKNNRQRTWAPRQLGLLAGRILLSIGTGSIGSAVAAAAKALDMRTIGVSRQGRTANGFDRVARIDQLMGLLGEADFVLLALPLTAETGDLIGPAQLAAMKRGAVLINIARGGLIDEGALLHALKSEHLAGAVLDVFREEPLPANSPLWEHPKIVVTPHVSGRFAGGHDHAAQLFVENFHLYVAGQPLKSEVDFARGY